MAIAANPIHATAVGVITTMMMAVDSFRWVSYAAGAGDECTVQDSGGNILFDSDAPGAAFIDVMKRPTTPLANGLNVTALDSGDLYIYFK